MAAPRQTLYKLISVVLLSGFAAFFVCIFMIDSSFLTKLWLPYITIHCILAFVVQYIHTREDKKKMQPTHSGKMLFKIFAMLSIGFSILITTIVISLCSEPYCTEIRSSSIDPVIVYTIIAVFEYFHLCTFFDFCFIKFAGTRHLLYRLSISFPAMLHVTTLVLSSFVLWLYPISAYFAVHYDFVYLPIIIYILIYLLSINGFYNSFSTKWSSIHIDMKLHERNIASNVHKKEQPKLPLLNEPKQTNKRTKTLSNNGDKYPMRCNPKQYISNIGDDCIRICQITDPHIGPLMKVDRLQRICRDIVHKDPDLVLLTGDYFTGEADLDGLLLKALEPLKSIGFKCFACLGNHDMETNEIYNRTICELKSLGITLLRNESVIYDKLSTRAIQIIGFDYIWYGEKDRRERHRNILAHNSCPIECENRRIVLLHDPSGFDYFDEDENVVVFSGHTHGGMMGFISCGFQWTLFRQMLQRPDHGLWQKGSNKLYIHRGQGSRALYGNYVLRCGVPTENSMVHIEW